MDQIEVIKYYSRLEVQQAILSYTTDREVGIRFGLGSFGKRPDILQFTGDIAEFAKRGVTSFHISEERWNDPMQLEPGMTKKSLDGLRKGWDLILDIDTLFWDYAKYTAFLLVEALKFHDIKHIGVKFSGSKGFHLCIPFEAFPDEVNGIATKDLFPEGLRVMAAYLQQMIGERLAIKIFEKDDFNTLATKAEKKKEDLMENGKFNPFSIIDIDTVLISNRHLFRSPYSLHEKSGLVSLPIHQDEVLRFEKEMAKPENINFNSSFMDLENLEKNEAKDLIIQAFDWDSRRKIRMKEKPKETKEFELPKVAIPKDFFPPCIHNALKGNMEDGKKRTIFIFIKFLRHMGWDWANIEKEIKDWNIKNPQPLRENYVVAQISWHKKQRENALCPNCANAAYYKDLGICNPENLCSKIKNPVNFAIRKSRAYEKHKPKQKKKKASKTPIKSS